MPAENTILEALDTLGRKDEARTAIEKIKLAESFVQQEPTREIPSKDWFASLRETMKSAASNTAHTGA